MEFKDTFKDTMKLILNGIKKGAEWGWKHKKDIGEGIRIGKELIPQNNTDNSGYDSTRAAENRFTDLENACTSVAEALSEYIEQNENRFSTLEDALAKKTQENENRFSTLEDALAKKTQEAEKIKEDISLFKKQLLISNIIASVAIVATIVLAIVL